MVRLRRIAFLFLLLSGNLAGAQSTDINVAMQVPPPNSLHWDDIWEVSIYNNIASAMMPTTIDITVEFNWTNKVYEAVTEKFIVTEGTTYLNAAIAKTKNLTILTEDLDHKVFFTRYNRMNPQLIRSFRQYTVHDTDLHLSPYL